MLFRKSAGNWALSQYSTDVYCSVTLLVMSYRSMTNNNVLDYVEKVFEVKDREHNQPSFLETVMYSFILKINCKVNKLFYTGCILWQTYLFFHMGNVYCNWNFILFFPGIKLNLIYCVTTSAQHFLVINGCYFIQTSNENTRHIFITVLKWIFTKQVFVCHD